MPNLTLFGVVAMEGWVAIRKTNRLGCDIMNGMETAREEAEHAVTERRRGYAGEKPPNPAMEVDSIIEHMEGIQKRLSRLKNTVDIS